MKTNKGLIVLKPEVVIARLNLMIKNNIGDNQTNLDVKKMVQSGELEGYECPENPMNFSIGVKSNASK